MIRHRHTALLALGFHPVGVFCCPHAGYGAGGE